MKSNIGYTLIFSSNEESKKNFILPMLCLLFTSFGIIFSSISAFNLPFNMTKIVMAATLFVILESFIFCFLKKYKVVANLIVIGIWAAIFCAFRDLLFKGIIQGFSFISETIEQSQKINWNYQTVINYDSQLMELAFIVLLFPVILILAYSLYGKVNIMIWLLVVVPIMEPMLFFNRLPHLWSFAMLMVAGIATLVLSNANSPLKNSAGDIRNVQNANTSAILIAATIGIFLTITLLLVNETGYHSFINKIPGRAAAKTDIVKTLSPTFEEKTPPQGGITGGNFSKTDKFSFTGETALTIEADKLLGNLYIRGFVGDNYTSTGWENADFDADKSVDIIEFDNMELSNLFHSQKRELKITLGEAAEVEYDYEPYFVLSRKGKAFEYFETANYDNNLFLLSKQEIYNSLLNSVGLSKGKVTKELLDQCFRDEEKYYEKVKTNYLKIPKSASAIYDEYAQMVGKFNNIENIIKYVMGDLSSRANYTLSPGETPEDKDFATYFLYENKKGYCTHFATTAVLIFRSMGIPARYVEGYVVNAGDYTSGTQTKDDKYLINVKDTASHAWCEVYLEGFGWMPVEVTPGLTPMPTGDTADAKGNSIEYESEGKTKINQIAVETPKIESQEIEESFSENGGSGSEAKGKGSGILYTIMLIIICLLLVAFCIGIVRYSSIRKWKKILESNDKKVSILGWFKLFKLVYKDDNYISLISWGEEIEKQQIFDKGFIRFVIYVVQKTMYSKLKECEESNVSDQEYERARKNLIYCILQTYKRLTFMEKVKWLLILRLPLPKKECKILESKVNTCGT